MSNTRVVLVTGGMGGLGETISTKMADAGYKVAVTYSPGNTKHAEWVAGMKGRGYDIAAVPCDVADLDSCAKAVAEVTAKVGPVDVLVNNAGITRDMTFKKMDKVNWDAVMRTNLDSLFNMSKQVVEPMLQKKWGRLINISSVNGQKGAFGQCNYAAAKAGVAGMTRALARELGSRGITVNCIAPGFIETDMTRGLPESQTAALLAQIPVGKLGAPADVAHAVAFLSSPFASYITGTTLHVNGGMYMQ